MINLSNHPVKGWGPAQLAEAEKSYGRVVDLPFPAIPAAASSDEIVDLSSEFVNQCKKLLANRGGPHAIHVMGEMTFTFVLVKQLQRAGFHCVASTSKRKVEQVAPGEKKSIFTFVQFRSYPIL